LVLVLCGLAAFETVADEFLLERQRGWVLMEVWSTIRIRGNARRSALALTPSDPNLTLTRTQHPAIVGNTENIKPFTYAGFATLCNAQQPLTAHS
jgi:hypothetical protein